MLLKPTSYPEGSDADHSPHLGPKSRMGRSYNPLPLDSCMAVARLLFYLFIRQKKASNSLRVEGES
jgi:hypothetical protein